MSYHRDYLKKKAVSLNSPVYHNAYKKCRNEVNRRIKLMLKLTIIKQVWKIVLIVRIAGIS